jgi:thiamine pyrophosphate-dependent acetolactate synthase large subunit-like protein
MAIGAKLAAPDRPVAALAGDGGPAIARGFGIGGVRVRTAEELEPAVVAALEADGPTLIELRPEA